MSILSRTQTSLCQKLIDEYDAKIDPILRSKNKISSYVNQLISTVSDMSFSPQTTIDEKLRDLRNDARGYIPNTRERDVDQILEFIQECTFLAGDESLSNPISLTNQIGNSTGNKITELMDSAKDLIPEFGVAQLVDQIRQLLGTTGISTSLGNMDKIINCVGLLCGASFSSKLSTMTSVINDIYSDLHLNSSPVSTSYGDIDLPEIYSTAGLSAAQINKVTSAVDGFQDIRTDLSSSINTIISSIKTIL